jgi:hypothetical protein
LQARFPHADAGYKKFNRRLIAPTIFRNELFGENVEGFFLVEARVTAQRARSNGTVCRTGFSMELTQQFVTPCDEAVQIPSPF